MTQEERDKIERCPIYICGDTQISMQIEAKLRMIGFRDISLIANDGETVLHMPSELTSIYPLDFIMGAAAIVTSPTSGLVSGSSVRLHMARYICGYCAFWHMDGYEWLRQSLPAIENSEHSQSAVRLAARMGAGIAANVAAGRSVKLYPRFYLKDLT